MRAFSEPTSSAPEHPARSREGWTLIVTGLPEDTQEDDISQAFAPHGDIVGLQLPLDRRTGNVKGYCMLEYREKGEAEAAMREMDGREVCGHTVSVGWGFRDSRAGASAARKGGGAAPSSSSTRRGRSRSPR
mmetsp:Transcript_8610/g.26733  ORF Transcript_8610/g.26733 Transcript_8610/m.26733 type:complete len:132 (+) Transcript_8610:87-482(+)